MNALRMLLLVAALSSLAPASRADSIWGRRTQRFAFLFEDNRARNVGDLLTIVIRETSSINQREIRDLSKATDSKGTFKYGGTTTSDNASRSGTVDFSAQNTSSRNFDGAALFTSDRVFGDRMTVTVVDILPNGNMVVEGHRTRVISGEKRNLRITGMVRPSDLSPANVVLSESVANFRIEYFGRGVDTNFTSQGYLGKLFNLLWPY